MVECKWKKGTSIEIYDSSKANQVKVSCVFQDNFFLLIINALNVFWMEYVNASNEWNV